MIGTENREIVRDKLKFLGFIEKPDELANKCNAHIFLNQTWKQ